MYATLVDAHYPFNVEMAGTFNTDTTQQYQVIILPAIHCLTDNDANALEKWVRQGGWLVATADTGIADADGKSRLAPANSILGPLPGTAQTATGGYHGYNRPRITICSWRYPTYQSG